MIKYGLIDTKRIKKKQVTHLHPQTILMPKVIMAKIWSQKSTHLDHSYLKYALK